MASILDTATCAEGTLRTDFGCLPNSPIGFVAQFYGWGLGLIGLVGLLFLIIGGYYFLMSRGNQSYIQKGKSYITYAIIGILLAVFGFVFISVIAGNILKIPGFS